MQDVFLSKSDYYASMSDPLLALGAMCGLDGLSTNAEGYCCLSIGGQIVHLQRWLGSRRIRLSTEVSPWPVRGDRLSAEVTAALAALRAESIDVRVLDDEAYCLQSVFDLPAPGMGNGPALLNAIDALLLQARGWQRLVAKSLQWTMPATRAVALKLT